MPAFARLRSSAEISKVFASSQRLRGGFATLLWSPRTTGETRMAFCVPMKCGNAVRRNRIRRVLRELARRHAALLPPSADLVIIPSPGRATWSTRELDKDFEKLLQRVGESGSGTGSGPQPPRG
ncbi:MAG: ribonuclease P protein component [Planctomycetota bacterium]